MLNILDFKGKAIHIHGDIPVEITEDTITIGFVPSRPLPSYQPFVCNPITSGQTFGINPYPTTYTNGTIFTK